MGEKHISNHSTQMTVGTAASNAVVSTSTKVDAARTTGLRVKKIMAAMTFAGKTEGEGPFFVGISQSGWTDTEISEAIIADPQGPQDGSDQDEAVREIVPIWVIPQGGTESDVDQGEIRFRKIPYFWHNVPEGTGISFWVMNKTGAQATTGLVVNVHSIIVGEWNRD